MMAAATEQVKAAQRQIATRWPEETPRETDHAAESRRWVQTMHDLHAPTRRAAELRSQFPEEYGAILRAAARSLESDPRTRQQLYALLNCAPEKQA